MYPFWHDLFADKKGGEIFTLFGGWHFFYIALTLVAVTVVLLCLRWKPEETKVKITRIFVSLAFGLYVADFFLMPLAYGEIDIEKLPFHACTAMCVMNFFSYRRRFLERFRTSFVLLGLISNLVYLIYPAGVMWYAVHPLSYRVVQTMLFHSIMTVYCILALICEREKIGWRTICRDLAVTVCMTLWAMLGNYVYSGTADGYSRIFNWFFVVRDPFYAIPEAISPFVMPLLNIALFFAAEAVLRLIMMAFRGGKAPEKAGNLRK